MDGVSALHSISDASDAATPDVGPRVDHLTWAKQLPADPPCQYHLAE